MYTSDIRGAGTDANVSIIMFGSNSVDTGKLKLGELVGVVGWDSVDTGSSSSVGAGGWVVG